MKFEKILIMSIAILLTAAGCSLDYEFTDSIPGQDESGGSQIPVDELLTTAYSSLGTVWGSQEQTFALSTPASDEMVTPTRATDWSDNGVWRQLSSHTWDPTHRDVREAWNNLNRGLFRTIEGLARNPDAQQTAEFNFLQAYYMYWLVDYYGVVPIREADSGPEDLPTTLSRNAATDRIIQLLESAIPNLPETSTVGRANKNSARALLAKVFLNEAVFRQNDPLAVEEANPGPYNFDNAKMQQVIDLVDAIQGYELADNYFDNFIPNNAETSPELIFTIPHLRGAQVGGENARTRYYMTLHYNQSPGGWNGFATLSEFYATNFTDDNDQRKGSDIPGVTGELTGIRGGFLEGQQFDQDGNELTDRAGAPLVFTNDVQLGGNNESQGVRVIKYIPDFENLDSPENDYVLLRWADMLLVKAEALLRQGNAGEALTIVNELRAQRGTTPLASLDEASLLAERGREMYWEGWRRNDQIRFGTFLAPHPSDPSAGFPQVKGQSEPFRVLYPIPQRALDSNSNLSQNPGY